MELFRKQIEFLEASKDAVIPTFRDSINLNAAVLENDITEDQLFDLGEDGFNRKLPGYTRFTIALKTAKGQPTDRTTLRDTEQFHNRMTVQGFDLFMEISSATPYTNTLILRYGEAIMRPSFENMEIFIEDFFIPLYDTKLKDQ